MAMTIWRTQNDAEAKKSTGAKAARSPMTQGIASRQVNGPAPMPSTKRPKKV